LQKHLSASAELFGKTIERNLQGLRKADDNGNKREKKIHDVYRSAMSVKKELGKEGEKMRCFL